MAMSFRSEDSWRSSVMSAGRMGRVIAQNSEIDEEALAQGLQMRARVASRQVVTPETAFYRVLEEAKVYMIDIRMKGELNPNGAETNQTSREHHGNDQEAQEEQEEDDDDEEHVVSIMEMIKTSGRTTSRDRIQMQNDRNAYCVRKMPDEIVASSGRLRCPYGPSQQLTTFIQLAHIDNGYMMLSMQQTTKQTKPRASTTERVFLEKLPDTEQPFHEKGRFYFRVLVPIELRRGPDLLAPIISRHLFKNAEEIVECCEVYRCPQSAVTFVKLAYEDGWIFETLNSGIRVLEKLATQPEIENGAFFYIVRIPVGIRVAPNIMAQRAGKGYRLHSVVEGSQRFTPPGSKITYVKVCREKNSRCSCSQGHQSGHDVGGASGSSPKAKTRIELSDEERSFIPRSSSTSSLIGNPSTTSCSGGWIFETTMDGQVVLEPIAKPIVRQIERLFYRVLEDVDVLPTPGLFTVGSGKSSNNNRASAADAPELSKRKRLKDTLVECSERMVPALPASESDGGKVPEMAFLKLRHDVGWICERRLQPPYPLALEQVQGFAVSRDQPKFYRVLVPVHLRSAPDFDCPRIPGVSPLAVGCVFESCLQYTPPGSRLTYIKVTSDSSAPTNSGSNGWVFDKTPSGDRVLEALDEDPEKKNGKFFFRVLADKKEVLLSPERNGEVVKFLFQNTFFPAEMEYTLPRTQETYVRLSKEKGWVLLDTPEAQEQDHTLQRISEEVYNLYYMPPSWVSIGHPSRTWFKVPDDTCRTVLVEETLLQMQVFQSRNILAASSQGRDSVPLSRRGSITFHNGDKGDNGAKTTTTWRCTLEEIMHPASTLLFTFPWKQIWWIFEMGDDDDDESGERHSVELQHGLRGGFKSVLFDGQVQIQNRSVGDILWDAGSEFVFEWNNHTFKVIIALEGAFFSQYLQFYSYSLLVDDEEIVPTTF